MTDAKIKITAEDAASRVLAQVRSSMAQVDSQAAKLSGVLAGLGVAFSAGAALAWTRNIVDGVDALNDLKDATGSSIENISALEDVAARTGTSFDTVGTSLVKFNQALNAAEPDSKIAEALNAIGLSSKELKTLDPSEALRRTAVALSGFADDGNKARLTQELFGKSLREVAPFLKDLSEQGKLNATVTTEQAQAAEEFNKQLFALQKNATDSGRALVSDLVPALNSVLGNFNKLREKGLFGTVVKDAAYDLIGLGLLTENSAKDIENLTKTRDALLQRGEKSGFTDSLKKDLEEVNRLLEVSNIRLDSLFSKNAPKPPEEETRKSAPNIGGKDTKNGKDLDADFKRYLENLDRQLEKSKELTVLEQLMVDIEKQRLTVTPAQQQKLQSLAQEVDQLKAQEEAQRMLNDARKAEDAYIQKLLSENSALEENAKKMREHVEEIGLTTEQVNALRLARQDETIAIEQTNLALERAAGIGERELEQRQRKIDLLKEERDLTAKGQVKQAAADTAKEQERASKEFADGLRTDLKGAFSAAFRDSKDPLKAFGDAIEDVMYSRAATGLAEAVLKYGEQLLATNSSAAISGSGGGFDLASLFSFDGGGFTGSGSRSGGLDGKGGFMAMLHPQETVLDHTKGQGSGSAGSVSIVQHINIDSRSDQATIRAAMVQAKDMAKAEIIQSRQRGGVFS
jgi:hypothetical protein